MNQCKYSNSENTHTLFFFCKFKKKNKRKIKRRLWDNRCWIEAKIFGEHRLAQNSHWIASMVAATAKSQFNRISLTEHSKDLSLGRQNKTRPRESSKGSEGKKTRKIKSLNMKTPTQYSELTKRKVKSPRSDLVDGQCSHWIPCRKNNWILFEHLKHLVRHQALVYDNFKDKLFEPIGRHDQIALLATILTPGVLHTEFRWFSIILKSGE